METQIRMYDGKVYGVKVSKYGLENGYLDYQALSELVGGCILNNSVRLMTLEDWDVVHGNTDNDIYQEYIISEFGFKFLAEHTDELVLYNERLDMYIWAVSHFGTSWDYVLTDVKLVEG